MGSPQDLSHLWEFLERFTVEAAYSSALSDLIISWCWLVGFPFELGTVTGLMNHLIIWRLVLGLCFYRLHRLDVCPCSEFIPVNQRKYRDRKRHMRRSSAPHTGLQTQKVGI